MIPTADAHELSLQPVPWTRLEYAAHKLFLKGRSEIRLESVPSSRLAGELIESPEGSALGPRGSRAGRLELRSAFAGRESRSRVWFDPDTVNAFQRLKERPGKDPYRKTYRYAREGVYEHRCAPGDASEKGRPWEQWSQIEETFHAHPSGHRRCSTVIEPALLFYLVSAVDLSAAFEVCAFTDRALHRVQIRPAGSESLAIDYVERSPSGENRRQRQIEARRFAVSAQPLAGGASDFELLGLQGDVEIYLDPDTRVPVRIAGRVPKLGRLEVELTAVDLR